MTELNPLIWVAYHSDGTEVEGDFDVPGRKDYDKIDREKLKDFELQDKITKESIFKLQIEKDQRLICRRRAWMDFGTGEILGYMYLVGWQKTINGKNEQVVYHIFSDGTIKKLDGWIGGEPEFRNDEK